MLTQAYSRARRWRVCLDECQMVREATTNLAKACRDLVSTHRWMISGTPLTTKIDDLNGELQFLRVWPFSLQARGPRHIPIHIREIRQISSAI